MKHTITRSPVPRETFLAIDTLCEEYRNKLDDYVDNLLWWNKRINLVSRDVPRETIAEHVRHSMILHALEPFREAEFVVDTGTGGGLPGLPLAITHPGKEYLLNDIVTKKTLAVRQMARKLQLGNVDTFDGSIARLDLSRPFLLISKHAFKINDLVKMTSEMPWTEMFFYKGLNFEDELEDVDIPLKIVAYDLSNEGSFYKDKAIVLVKRQ